MDEGQEKEWKGGREVGGGGKVEGREGGGEGGWRGRGGGGEGGEGGGGEGEGEGEGVHCYIVHTRQVELGTVQ